MPEAAHPSHPRITQSPVTLSYPPFPKCMRVSGQPEALEGKTQRKTYILRFLREKPHIELEALRLALPKTRFLTSTYITFTSLDSFTPLFLPVTLSRLACAPRPTYNTPSTPKPLPPKGVMSQFTVDQALQI